MSYLIWIDKEKKQVLHPDIISFIDSFKDLSEKEMLYVVLYADYNSPFKQFPDHDRKRRAMFHAFDENELELIESPRILIAVEDYRSLQYDPDIELAKRYQAKIDRFLEQLDKDESPSSVKKIQDAITSLRNNIQELNQRVFDKTMKQGQIKGDRRLSFIEESKNNRKRFQQIITTKPV